MPEVRLLEHTSQMVADLESQLLRRRTPELAALGFPSSFALPCYDISIANVPATLAAMLGGELSGAAPALPDWMWTDMSTGVRRAVLLILDSVGWLHFRSLMQDEPDLFLARLGRDGRLLPITSVFPTTTTAALLTLWTGRPPAQHGVVGHVLYLRELGLVVNMLMLSPVGEARRGQMFERGLTLEEFLPVPSLGQTLSGQGISTRTLIDGELSQTGFSNLSFRGVREVNSFVTSADMCVHLCQMVTAYREEYLLLVAYLAEMDNIGHMEGPQAGGWQAALRALSYSLEHEFYNRLSPEERRGTVLAITADHGQLEGDGHSVPLADHPELQNNLLLPVTGGLRSSYLFTRQGRMEQVQQYFAEQLADDFAVVRSDAAMEAGLLGPGEPVIETPYRLGDLTVIGRDNRVLDYRKRILPLRGMHGGATPSEMLVPFLLVRLD